VLAFDVGTTYSGISYRYEFPRFRTINDHTVIKVYSIPVKCQKSKVLQGQQSSAVLLFGVVDLMGVDFPHMSRLVALPKYPP
jgi:hypothetical protein